MFYLCVVDVHLYPSVGVSRHIAALSYIAVDCFHGVWDSVERIRCVGVSPCAQTVSPLDPEQTEHFVSDGVYRFSRNPMYAGLGCWLVAWAGYLAHPLPWLFLAAFVAYMTWFQIMPEERVLAQKFGAEYESYCWRVRRWL